MYKFFKTGLVLASYLASVLAQDVPAATPYAEMESTYGDGEYDVTMNAAGCYVLTGTMLLVVVCEDELGAEEVVKVNGKEYSWVNGTVTNMSPTHGLCDFALDSLDVDLTEALITYPETLPVTTPITLKPTQVLKFAFLLPYEDGAAFVGVTDEMRSCPMEGGVVDKTGAAVTSATTGVKDTASNVKDTAAGAVGKVTGSGATDDTGATAATGADTTKGTAATPPPSAQRTPRPTEEQAKATAPVAETPKDASKAKAEEKETTTVKTHSAAGTLSKSTVIMAFSAIVAISAALPFLC